MKVNQGRTLASSSSSSVNVSKGTTGDEKKRPQKTTRPKLACNFTTKPYPGPKITFDYTYSDKFKVESYDQVCADTEKRLEGMPIGKPSSSSLEVEDGISDSQSSNSSWPSLRGRKT